MGEDWDDDDFEERRPFSPLMLWGRVCVFGSLIAFGFFVFGMTSWAVNPAKRPAATANP